MATAASPTLPPSVLKHAKHAYEEQRASKLNAADQGFDIFLQRLSSPERTAPSPVSVDTSHPLSQYFISSSHNTYLLGNQLWSKSSTDAYKQVLKRGGRCIEIDVWNGESTPTSSSSENEGGEASKLRGLVKKGLGRLRIGGEAKKLDEGEHEHSDHSLANDDTLMPTPWRTTSGRTEPRVLHGYTATKEVPFRKVCEIIREYAFRASDLPLIVSLEVHCDNGQQEKMVEIMHDNWKQYLAPMPDEFSDSTPLPTLESLRKRILIKVKYTAPDKAAKKKKKTSNVSRARALSSVSDDQHSDEEEAQVEPVKKGKICEALGSLGIYTRSCHFTSFDQPEAHIPTHVFALSEKKLLALQEEQPEALWKHNQSFLLRAYPKGTRVGSSNLDPVPFWQKGVQMVALNWQDLSDDAMMFNDAMFANTGGWVLKPEGHRSTSTAGSAPAPIERKQVKLTIRLLAAQRLDHGARFEPDAYVKCELHVGDRIEKRESQVRHSRDPDFSGEAIVFDGIKGVEPQLAFLRIRIMDDVSYQKDRMLGWTCFRLDRLPSGIRLLPLKGADARANGSSLLVATELTLDTEGTAHGVESPPGTRLDQPPAHS